MKKWVLSVVFASICFGAHAEQPKKKILFIAGKDSHGAGQHEHTAGTKLLATAFNESGLPVETTVVTGGWPTDPAIFDDKDAVVIYCDGGGGHVVMPHLESFDKVMKRGVGLACIHYAVEVPKGKPGEYFLEWIGGYFETDWSVNPHWDADIKVGRPHVPCNGVNDFVINDEWYFHMRFQPDMKGIKPVFSAIAPPSTMTRPDGRHSGNPFVRAAVAAQQPQHIAWTYERPDGGRGFGFTGGHWHRNWENDDFRTAVLNSIWWIAKGEVPENGVPSKKPDMTLPGKQAAAPSKPINLSKAAFVSPPISASTPGQAIDIEVSLEGASELHLVVTDGGDGFSCDWANWVEPRLVGPVGESPLTGLPWTRATSKWRTPVIGHNINGGKMKVAGADVAYGIGTHAESVISYKIPAGFTHVRVRGALDDGGTSQGCGSTVQFAVFTVNPY